METQSIPVIFDGHNDVLLTLYTAKRDVFFTQNDQGHLDLPRAREGLSWLPWPSGPLLHAN